MQQREDDLERFAEHLAGAVLDALEGRRAISKTDVAWALRRALEEWRDRRMWSAGDDAIAVFLKARVRECEERRKAYQRAYREVDAVMESLIQRDVDITRENYLRLACGSELPEEWTAELESELPIELQYKD
jgi:hypothetical protein